MGQPIRVDLAPLRTLGGQILAVGDELRRNTVAVDGRLASPAGAGTRGWSTTGAVTGAAQGWHEYLTALAGRIEVVLVDPFVLQSPLVQLGLNRTSYTCALLPQLREST